MSRSPHEILCEGNFPMNELRGDLVALSLIPPHDFSNVPISILPDELLCEIFSYEVAGPDDSQHGAIFKVNLQRAKAPFVISTVCQRWREACCSRAKLWHYILIPNRQPTEFMSAYLQLVFGRSRDASLDIIFGYVEEEWIEEYERQVFPLLVTQRHRWRRLVAEMEPEVAPNLLRLLCAPTARLRTIQLSVQQEQTHRGFRILDVDLEEVEASFDAVAFLPDAPSMYCVTMVNIAPVWKTWHAAIQPSLQMLQVLQNVIPTSTLWALLRRHSQVKFVALHATECPVTSADEHHPGDICLPQLKKLWLRAGPAAMFMAHPTAVLMPTLRTLILGRYSVAKLHAFFRHLHATSSLRRLELRSITLADSAVTAVAALERLEHVEIKNAFLTAALFERLVQSDVGNVMWPRVRNLKLVATQVATAATECGLQFARMRRDPGPSSDEESGDPVLRWVRCQLDLPSRNSGFSDEQVQEIATIRREVKAIVTLELP
ncbi:hypothetical protein BKA62DRAFT_704826 [Auriculariales sp. MPI-PUGE-AT-0066]|nr:hypothetical protein BKA62DRAFT_704826 [Auriculariales sp. MPI-PUGE-AT-0066]